MATKVLWRKFRKYRGPLIRGTAEFPPPTGTRKTFHVERAFWLTCKVETGAKFGMVQSYDGCGMTCGLDQHIAVYPRELADKDNNTLDDQGTLWKLLRRMETAGDYTTFYFNNAVRELWDGLAEFGCYLAQDGVLRRVDDGLAVSGNFIREMLTPGRGCPSTKYQKGRAEQWARLFHAVFNHIAGFKAQVEYGKEHLVKRTKRRKIYLGHRKTGEVSPHALAYSSEITVLQVGQEFSLEEDLALCIYQAHSVNAPAIANKCLKKAKTMYERWPKKLIQLLGNSSYGRWDDDLKNGRYQRTRSAARASGLWPRAMFDGKAAVMPKDLPG